MTVCLSLGSTIYREDTGDEPVAVRDGKTRWWGEGQYAGSWRGMGQAVGGTGASASARRRSARQTLRDRGCPSEKDHLPCGPSGATGHGPLCCQCGVSAQHSTPPVERLWLPLAGCHATADQACAPLTGRMPPGIGHKLLPNSECHAPEIPIAATCLSLLVLWRPLRCLASAEAASFVAGLAGYCTVSAAQAPDPSQQRWPSRYQYHFSATTIRSTLKRLPSGAALAVADAKSREAPDLGWLVTQESGTCYTVKSLTTTGPKPEIELW